MAYRAEDVKFVLRLGQALDVGLFDHQVVILHFEAAAIHQLGALLLFSLMRAVHVGPVTVVDRRILAPQRPPLDDRNLAIVLLQVREELELVKFG